MGFKDRSLGKCKAMSLREQNCGNKILSKQKCDVCFFAEIKIFNNNFENQNQSIH